MEVKGIISDMFEDAFSYPQLNTILMVEKFISENSAVYKRKVLWQKLPKKMKYQTFSVILNYLIHSNKVGIDKEGKVVWIGITSGKLLKNSIRAK